VMDSYDVNEMRLAAQLADSAPDNSITLFDKGFYSLGLGFLHDYGGGLGEIRRKNARENGGVAGNRERRGSAARREREKWGRRSGSP